MRRIKLKMEEIVQEYHQEIASANDVFEVLGGWSAYAVHGNTYNFREAMLHLIEQKLSE